MSFCSGSCSSLALPASIPPGGLVIPRYSSFQLSGGSGPCTSSSFTCTWLLSSRTPSTSRKKKKKAAIITDVNSSNSSGASSSQHPEEEEEVVYQGVYGPWTIQPSDVQEVILYRSGLVTAAASFVVASSALFLPNDSELGGFVRRNIDLFYASGAFGLGLSLYLIHIYVTQIKRTLQALWVLGAFGSLATYANFALPAGKNLVDYVLQYPAATWLVGPLFAALTGLVFKEGLCYGKLEAGVLTFIIPAALLGHLTGLMDGGTKMNLVGIWMGLFVVFAGRKFMQPIKDDIGDKSVFMFNSLAEEEKKDLINELQQQQQQQQNNKFES